MRVSINLIKREVNLVRKVEVLIAFLARYNDSFFEKNDLFEVIIIVKLLFVRF